MMNNNFLIEFPYMHIYVFNTIFKLAAQIVNFFLQSIYYISIFIKFLVFKFALKNTIIFAKLQF